MPPNFTSLLVLLFSAVPGYLYLTRYESRALRERPGAAREIAELVAVGIFVTLGSAAAVFALAEVVPGLAKLDGTASGGPYLRTHAWDAVRSGMVVLLLSCVVCSALGELRGRRHGAGAAGNLPGTVWSVLLRRGPDQGSPEVEVFMDDGTRPPPRQHLSIRLHQIRQPQSRQIIPRQHPGIHGQPQIPIRTALLVQGPQEPPVPELVDPPLVDHMPGDRPQLVQRLLVPHVTVLRRQHLADRGEFKRPVRRKVDASREAGRQPGVRGQQPVHALRIARQDHHKVIAIVLGPLQQHLQGLVAVRIALAVTGVGERVRLVDEEDATDRRVDQLVGLHSRLAQILTDQVGPLRLDEMVPAEQPEGVEDPPENAGHGGLAGTRRPGEDEVPFRRLNRQPLPGPQPSHVQLGGQRLDLALDRLQPHHALKLVERLLQ
jgi:hypothetical protein